MSSWNSYDNVPLWFTPGTYFSEHRLPEFHIDGLQACGRLTHCLQRTCPVSDDSVNLSSPSLLWIGTPCPCGGRAHQFRAHLWSQCSVLELQRPTGHAHSGPSGPHTLRSPPHSLLDMRRRRRGQEQACSDHTNEINHIHTS